MKRLSATELDHLRFAARRPKLRADVEGMAQLIRSRIPRLEATVRRTEALATEQREMLQRAQDNLADVEKLLATTEIEA